MTSLPLFIRTASSTDLPAITAIYGHHVVHGRGSFELDAPDLTEMTRRHAAVLAQHLPYLVANQGTQVLGFAYANAFRPRPAFRFLAMAAKVWAVRCWRNSCAAVNCWGFGRCWR